MTSECFQSDNGQIIFLANMDQLLVPAYLLTGSHEQAGECFLEACSNFAPEAGQEALISARRAVVKAALGRIAGDVAKGAANPSRKDRIDSAELSAAKAGNEKFQLDSKSFRCALLSLDTFQRAALVLRLYERYSSEEAANLLQVSRHTLESGWRCALLQLVDALKSTSPVEPLRMSKSKMGHRTCCWQIAKSPA